MNNTEQTAELAIKLRILVTTDVIGRYATHNIYLPPNSTLFFAGNCKPDWLSHHRGTDYITITIPVKKDSNTWLSCKKPNDYWVDFKPSRDCSHHIDLSNLTHDIKLAFDPQVTPENKKTGGLTLTPVS